jgi:hypothetical protein
MRPVTFLVAGPGASPVYAPDHYVSPFNVALGVQVSGVVNYTVRYTFDSVFAASFDPTTANWVDHPSLTAQTTTKDSNIAYPVQGIQLVINSGTGTARLVAIQAGGGGLA